MSNNTKSFIAEFGTYGAILLLSESVNGFRVHKETLAACGYISYPGDNINQYRLTKKGRCMADKLYAAIKDLPKPVEIITYE